MPQPTNPTGIASITSPKEMQILQATGGNKKAVDMLAKVKQMAKPSYAANLAEMNAKDTLGKMWVLGMKFKDMYGQSTGTEQQIEDTLGKGSASGAVNRLVYHVGKVAPNVLPTSWGSEDFESLKPTVAVALARMDIGTRPPKEVVKYYFRTLPSYNDPWHMFANKISGSMLTAFSRKFAASMGEIHADPRLQQIAATQTKALLKTIMPPQEYDKWISTQSWAK